MAEYKIIALEGDEDRAAALREIFTESGKYELAVSKSPKKLADMMDGSDDVAAIITNTEISNNVQDGLKFIKILFLKYQRYAVPLPPILVCSADQRGDTVKLYAYRFADLALIYYVLIKTEDLKRDSNKLIAILEKALAKRRELEENNPETKAKVVKEKVKALLKKTITLPSLPDVAIRVQDSLNDPEITMKKLGDTISTDMTLSANIIKLANSPQFGVSGTIATIDDACTQVGLNAIANTVMATKVFDALDSIPVDFDMKRLRRHSYAVGTIARIVARRCHALGNAQQQMQFSANMFAAGLLHDIGKVLLVEYFGEECNNIIDAVYANNWTMVQAETGVLGISHADAGFHAGIEWKFPVNMVNVIARHHWPLERILPKLKSKQGRLAQRVIRIADAASYELGYDMIRADGPPPAVDPELFNKTGISIEDFEKWKKDIKDDIAYTLEVLGGV